MTTENRTAEAVKRCTTCGTATDRLNGDGCCLTCEGWWLELDIAVIDALAERAGELIEAVMGREALFERLQANRAARGVGR
jgi:hypothetical protein